MSEDSLIINATDQAGNKLQRSVTCTAEDAARDKMLTFAQGINNLLTNNFVEAKHVQKVNLDDDPDGGYKPNAGYDVIGLPEDTIEPDASKTNPNLQLVPEEISAADLRAAIADTYFYDVGINYNGDGKLYIVQNDGQNGTLIRPDAGLGAKIIDDNGTKKLRVTVCEFKRTNSSGFYCDLIVRSTTTATCNQASATFTVTNN